LEQSPFQGTGNWVKKRMVRTESHRQGNKNDMVQKTLERREGSQSGFWKCQKKKKRPSVKNLGGGCQADSDEKSGGSAQVTMTHPDKIELLRRILKKQQGYE